MAVHDPDRLLGSILGSRFVVKHCVSSDEAGALYEVWDDKQSTEASVRVLRDVRPDEASLDKLAKLLAEVSGLGIKGVPRLLAAGRTKTQDVYYATSSVAGTSLSDAMAEEPLAPLSAARVVAAVGDILSKSHEGGVVHGGLHPGAVFVPDIERGRGALLVDFGLGPLTAGLDSTGSGAANVLLPFQAPEQTSNDPYDHRADVYSLGALLFFCLTGRPPFAGSSALELLALQLRGETPSLAKVDAKLKGNPLQSVIDTAMQVAADDRFESMANFVKAVRSAAEALASGKAVAARPTMQLGEKAEPKEKAKAEKKSAAKKAPSKPAEKPGKGSKKQKAGSPYRGKGAAAAWRAPSDETPAVWPYVAAVAIAAASIVIAFNWDAVTSTLNAIILADRSDPSPAPPPPAAAELMRPTPAPQPPPEQPRRRRDRDEEGPALPLPPDDPLSERAVRLISEGNEALLEGRTSLAVARFRAAKRAAPSSPGVARGLAIAYEKTGKRVQAAEEIRRYLELSPFAADANAMRLKLLAFESEE